MNEYLIIGVVVVGLSALVQLAAGIKSLIGNKDYVTKEDLLRLEDKLDQFKLHTERLSSEQNATSQSFTAGIAKLEQAMKGCLCIRCKNFSAFSP